MLFNSVVFLFAFLPVTYAVFWLLRSTRARYIWLAVTGYVFYAYWDARFCLLMLFSTLVSYFAGVARDLARAGDDVYSDFAHFTELGAAHVAADLRDSVRALVDRTSREREMAGMVMQASGNHVARPAGGLQ